MRSANTHGLHPALKGLHSAIVISILAIGIGAGPANPNTNNVARADAGSKVASLQDGERQKLRLDADWRFHLGDVIAGESGISIKNWRWKADDRGVSSAPEMAAVGVTTTGSDWHDATIEDIFHGRKGFAWYRSTLPAFAHTDRTLTFQNVDDNATVFLNGKLIGRHQGWGAAFDISLDSAWKPSGSNELAVLVENTAGGGGINGAVTLSSENDSAQGGPADPAYSDSSWSRVSLPHDFIVEGTFDPKASVSHGFLESNIGWYRKRFNVSDADLAKRLYIDFDGVYRNSTAWINGHKLGRHSSGYTSFEYDISPFVKTGANTLVVRADARFPEGWWYEGGGIYRHVWLLKTAQTHVAHWGTHVTSKVEGSAAGGQAPATVTIVTSIANDGADSSEITVTSQIVDPQGGVAATAKTGETLGSKQNAELTHVVRVDSAKLWSLDHPNLYKLITVVTSGGKTVDTYETPFGIRTIRFDPELGFFLNDHSVKIQGTCNHTDFAGVGVALPDHLHLYKIEKLKEMGSNAYRMSHNPPATELLDDCDRLGMLVMDENRHLGDTYSDHTPSGTPSDDLSDLKDLILRDRNHPSVIMWSMCNEEGLQGSPEGAHIFQAMMNVVHRYDTTRPITCAMNGGWGYGITNVEDLQGCNYNPGGYDYFHTTHPTIPMYGSETASTVSTRGQYANDRTLGYVSAYDVNAPPWAQTAEVAWSAIAKRPFVAGGYVWTGFDYRGEPTPYEWPCINSHFGIMDTCGFPKDNWWYYRSWWGDTPVVHILPHWNWAGKEGSQISVWCFGNCDHVELFLNGVSLGVQDMPKYGHVEWKVPYAAGKLEARGTTDGKVLATDVVETTGPAASVEAKSDRPEILADGEDVAVVAVSIRDAHGRIAPTADNLVKFSVSGNGRILGVGNGDPSSHERDKASQRSAFNGRCLVIVQAGTRAGDIVLTCQSAGLKPTTVSVHTLPPVPRR